MNLQKAFEDADPSVRCTALYLLLHSNLASHVTIDYLLRGLGDANLEVVSISLGCLIDRPSANISRSESVLKQAISCFDLNDRAIDRLLIDFLCTVCDTDFFELIGQDGVSVIAHSQCEGTCRRSEKVSAILALGDMRQRHLLQFDKWIKNTDSVYFTVALIASYKLGKDALDILQVALNQTDVSQKVVACKLLGNLGSTSVEMLRRSLLSTEPEVRLEAINSLGKIQSLATSTIPDLIFLIRNSDDPTVCRAMEALVLIDRQDTRVFRCLIHQLTRKNLIINDLDARLLSSLGIDAVRAITPLFVRACVPNHSNTDFYISTIEKIVADSRAANPALVATSLNEAMKLKDPCILRSSLSLITDYQLWYYLNIDELIELCLSDDHYVDYELVSLLNIVDPKYWTARGAWICYGPPAFSRSRTPAR